MGPSKDLDASKGFPGARWTALEDDHGMFEARNVSAKVREKVASLEFCDDQAHAFAAELAQTRLQTMSPADQKAFREFELRLEDARKPTHIPARPLGGDAAAVQARGAISAAARPNVMRQRSSFVAPGWTDISEKQQGLVWN